MRLTQYAQSKQLNEDQQKLFVEIECFLSDKDCASFLLKGYAGVGKTYITSILTDYFAELQRQFVLMAPTGKAASVLSEKCKLPVTTIHSEIYSCINKNIVEQINGEPTVRNKVQGYLRNSDYSADAVFIVDEASMVSDRSFKNETLNFGSGRVLKDLLAFVDLDSYPNRKLIFIGDAAQLPPVGMDTSPALTKHYLQENYNLNPMEYELTQVVRQKTDNQVTQILTGLRKGEIEPYICFPNKANFAPGVSNISFRDIEDRYFELCNFNVANASSVALISHCNWQVKEYNKRLRKVFFPDDEVLSVGERIVAAARYSHYDFTIANGEFGEITEVVSKIEVRTVCPDGIYEDYWSSFIDLLFLDVCVRFDDMEGNEQYFRTKVIINALYGTSPHLSEQENAALSEDFRNRHPHIDPRSEEYNDLYIRDPYVNAMRINYGYAFTCHKAQGGEWPVVIVDPIVQTNKHKMRCSWLYTAISRTSDQVYLINHVEDGTFLSF